MGIIEEIKKQLEPYDVIRKINELESKMRAIESWRVNDASPQFRDLFNATRDNASKALNAAQEAIKASDMAKAVEGKVIAVGEAVNDAKTQVFKVRDVFINISRKIRARVDNIKTITLNLSKAITDGMDSIKASADRTAARFPKWGEIFKKDIEHVYQQIQDTINEMAIPLERVKHYTDILKNPNIFDLLLTFYNVYMAFGHFVFIPHGTQGSVMQELEEGLTQTFGALQELGVDMKNGMYEWETNLKTLFSDVKNRFNIIGSIMESLNREIMALFTDIENEIAVLLPT